MIFVLFTITAEIAYVFVINAVFILLCGRLSSGLYYAILFINTVVIMLFKSIVEICCANVRWALFRLRYLCYVGQVMESPIHGS